MEFIYYFAKVGRANSFLEYSRTKARETSYTAVLWVGYSQNSILDFEDDLFPEQPKDLALLTFVSRKARKRSRIITFSKDRLQIWEIVGELRMMEAAELEPLKQLFQNENQRKDAFCVERGKDFEEAAKGFKALPVKLVGEFLRSLLPACIDSLSVYQSLNRGTFRALASIKGSVTDKDLQFLSPLLIRKVDILEQKDEEETYFSCLVRKYLDWLASTHLESFKEAAGFTDEQIYEVANSIMSPAQLETAASILLQSMGLTLDVGIGKGLDVIDVRASIRHKANAELKEKIIACLRGLGVTNHEVIKRFEEYETIEIQCKNFDAKNKSPEHILLLKPSGKNSDGRTITLDLIQDRLDSEGYRDWMNLISYNYMKDKATLKIENLASH